MRWLCVCFHISIFTRLGEGVPKEFPSTCRLSGQKCGPPYQKKKKNLDINNERMRIGGKRMPHQYSKSNAHLFSASSHC